ncbi:MAG: hypothetical protein AB8C84_02285 [Oligoflexales bacterium]
MRDFDKKSTDEIRKKHNEDLLQRFQRGESLKSYDSSSSWFPPRPVIEKDKKALELLHKSNPKAESSEKKHLTAVEDTEQNSSYTSNDEKLD